MTSTLDLSPATSFAEALANDERLFDRLIAYHSGFRRFAAVMMRDDTAPRLALGDISNMAGVPVGHVMEIAHGRDVAAAPSLPPEPTFSDSRGRDPEPFETAACNVDVRADLENGHEPLGRVLDALAVLRPAEDLVVEATFHPVPLRRLLSGRGFASFAEQIGDQHWRIRFRPDGTAPAARERAATKQAGSCCGGCCGSPRNGGVRTTA
jgi:uncharacterized protein (DUF2249 family)